MRPPRFLKLVQWILCVVMLTQPVIAVVPTEMARAASSEVTPWAASPAYHTAAPVEPLVATMPAPAAPMVAHAQVEETLRSSPIMFIEGETQPAVSAQGKERPTKTFQVQGGNGSIWLAPDAMWVTLLERPDEETLEERLLRGPERMEAMEARANEPVAGVNLKVSFEGANPNPRIEGFDPLDTKVSYFIGNDPAKWRPDVPVWGGVRYVNLYPGVDLIATSKDGAWDWTLEVKKATSPVSLPSYLFGFATAQATSEPSPLEAVKLRIEGAQGLDVLSSGKFAMQPAVGITTNVGDYALPLLDVVGAEPDPANVADVAGELVEAPFAEAAAPKVMMGASQAGTDDLLYSTFLGGSSHDEGYALAVDASGAAYVTGCTYYSSDFPTTPGAYDTTYNGGVDVFVTKLNASGSGLAYSTFLGGSEFDEGYALAVDASGAAYVTGDTASSTFPTTPGAYDTTFNGGADVFVTKLNASGSGLAYSTFLGGSSSEIGYGLAVDASGAAYVTGWASSPAFPTTPGAYDTTFSGSSEVFVTKVNASGSGLAYSTFLGGSGDDYGYALAVDGNGAAYVTGYTYDYPSSDFPTTPGAYDTTHNGGSDVFVTKVNASGSGLAYSTFLGGSGDDYGYALAVDASGAAYVTGYTASDFPTTPGAYDTTFNGYDDVFVTKLNASGSGLAYSTFLGGNGSDPAYALAVDASGAAYVTGWTSSPAFPTTPGAYDTTFSGSSEVFVTKLNASGSGLTYSTYLGGSSYEEAYALAVDASGAAYVTGRPGFSFPTTPGAYDTTPNGLDDVFVAKLRMGALPPLTAGQAAGVREADTNFDNYGAYTQGQVGNPINTRTGKHTEYEVDLSIPTLAGVLSFERSYSSENAKAINAGLLEEGTLSPGWNHNYEAHLILPTAPDTRVELYTAGGNRLGFEDNGDGTYDPETGVGGTLVLDDTGAEPVYIYRSSADIGYTFDDLGVLQSIDDGLGHELTLKYDGTGQLAEVYSADSLRGLFFDYGGDGQLDQVSTAIVDVSGVWVSDLAQSVSFSYDLTSSDLETVTDVRNQTWGYEYGDPLNPHFLTARTDPSGSLIVGIEYDNQGRAFREENGAGETVVELTYGLGGETTIAYGQDGVGGSVTHQYDAGDMLRHQTDSVGGDTETSYDPNNFRVDSVIDPKDNETTMEWSNDGANLEDTWDALLHSTHTEYDSRHNPTVVSNPDNTMTLFVYNQDGAVANPLTSEPVGNPAWDQDVLVLRIDNYVMSNPGTPDTNRVTRYEYNGQSLLSKVTSPDGTVTCTTYTPLSLPEDVTENCVPSTGLPGENAVTHYTYDDLGRVNTITDPVGRVTKYSYFDDDDLADEVIVNYDAGWLPYGDGGLYNLSTRTYRDALGRVYATVANFYDGTGGDLTAADISSGLATGRNRVERVYFDAAGRVETTVANFVGDLSSSTPSSFNPAYPDRNLVARTIYDGAGRVVATIGNYYEANIPGGGAPEPFDLNVDGATDVTLEISTTETQYNRISRVTYDAAGRVQTTTAAAWPGKANFYLGTYNLISANAYDLAGNVTASITNFDPGLTDGNSNALSTSIALSPGETPVSLIVDPDAPDRNVITCADYDALNRPVLTKTACVPGRADYTVSGDGLYNLVGATYYDNMGRVYATVSNYDGSRGQLDASERNFITRTYYDGLGRATHTVENFVGDIESATLPVYNPATPDRNLITGVFYNTRGYPAVTVRNLDTPTGLMPDPVRFANTGPDRNLATVSHYNKIGQVDWTVDSFVGDFQTLPETPPANFNPNAPDQNLLTTYIYDELGRQVKVIAGRGAESREGRTTYDLLGRTIRTVANYQDGVYSAADPDADITTTTDYLDLGRVVTVTGTTGIANRTWTDALGRVTQSVTDPGGEALTTTTTYDAAGRPVRTVVENGEDDQVTAARYDALGRAVENIANPDGPGPLRTVAIYDLLGRSTKSIANYVDGVYNPSTPDADITTYALYDNLGRLRRVFENFQGAPACNPTVTDVNVCTRSDYDAAGHLTSTTLGNGSQTSYQVDALGRVTREIIDPGDAQHKNITTDYRYDAAGNRVYLIRAPGVSGVEQVTQTVFDRLGRATATHYADPALDVATSYDAWGGRASMDDATGTGLWGYGYDDMNRLESVTDSSGQTVGYGYDGAGLRTALDAPSLSVDYVYDTAGRLDTITDPFSGGLVGYGYDGASRVTGMTRPGGVNTTYQYDIFGRLDVLTNSGEPGALSSFDYTLDARGNRVDVTEQLNGGVAEQGMNGLTAAATVPNPQPSGLWPLASALSPAAPSSISAYAETDQQSQPTRGPIDQLLGGFKPQFSPMTQNGENGNPASGAQSSIDELLSTLDAAWEAGAICQRRLYNSLRKKAEDARQLVATGDGVAAIVHLEAFIEELSAQAGQCIEQAVASRLTAQAQAAIDLIQPPVTATSEPASTETPTGVPEETATPTEVEGETETPTPAATATQSPTPTPAPTTEPTATATMAPPADGRPPQSDDPVFDLIRLPHDPAWEPTVQDGILVAGQDTYHSTLDRDGSLFRDERRSDIALQRDDALVPSDAEQPSERGATFSLVTVQQGATPIILPVPGELTGNAKGVSGWLVQDNIVLRPRLEDLYEINAFQAEGVELAYLLTKPLPDAASGSNLTLTVAIDSLLQPYQSEEGLFLLDASGATGIRVGTAKAIDANGSETPVSIVIASSSSNTTTGGRQSPNHSMSLVVPGAWLATAAYPILIDPLLASWTAGGARPAIAHDAVGNRALVAYSAGNSVKARLIDATTGQQINDVTLQSGSTTYANAAVLSATLHQGTSGPEYLVAYKWSTAVRLCRVNASTGAKISCASPVSSGVTQAQVDIAAIPATGESLLVWVGSAGVRAQRLTAGGAVSGTAITVASGTTPAVTFDVAADVYRVTWQASGNAMTAAVPHGSGQAQGAGLVSSTAAEPDVSYNSWLGETLFVWAGSDGSIYGRSMMGGSLGPIFQVSAGVIVVAEDHVPSVAPDRIRNGWVVAWQRNPLGHAIISSVPRGATGNLSARNRSVSVDGSTGEFTPAAALRGDGAALVALRTASEAKVFTVGELGGLVNLAWHYGYDALGRLTSACSQWVGSTCQGSRWTYTYDGAGNPTRFDRWNASGVKVDTIRYIYNGANQVKCLDADSSGTCSDPELWVYDAYGNLTFDRATRYVYDAANHLATVCDSGDGLTCDALGNETTYQYNGDGERVAQSVRKGILPATIATYTLDTALPLAQVLSETTSGQTTRYLHGLDLIAQSDGTSAEYSAYDGLGSVRQIVDGGGAVLTSQTFDPYGTPYSEMGTEQSAFGFTGEQTDENGLVYLRARYYNPAQGRFMQVDPSRMERNAYQYAGSSPGMNTDPSGNCASLFTIIGAFGQNLSDMANPQMSSYEASARFFNTIAAECQENHAFFGYAMQNPDAPHSPLFTDVMAQATWKMSVGPTIEDFAIGTTEQVHSFNRIVGAGNAGRWLGREDTSGYYFNRPDRYAIDMMGATGIVMEFTMLFAPDPSDFGINPSIGIVDDFLRGPSRRVAGSSAYDQLTLESSVLLDSGEAIPIEGLLPNLKMDALRAAGLDETQIQLILRHSAGVFDIDEITPLANGNNIMLSPYKSTAVKLPGEDRIWFGLSQSQSFAELQKQTYRLNARLLNDLPGNTAAMFPEIDAADRIIFNMKYNLIADHYLTAEELTYILSQPNILLPKTEFLVGFFP